MLKLSAKKLRDLMVERDLNQQDLALHSKISSTSISRLIKEDQPVRLTTLGRLARVLDVKYTELLTEE